MGNGLIWCVGNPIRPRAAYTCSLGSTGPSPSNDGWVKRTNLKHFCTQLIWAVWRASVSIISSCPEDSLYQGPKYFWKLWRFRKAVCYILIQFRFLIKHSWIRHESQDHNIRSSLFHHAQETISQNLLFPKVSQHIAPWKLLWLITSYYYYCTFNIRTFNIRVLTKHDSVSIIPDRGICCIIPP